MIVPVILLNYNSSGDCRKCVSFLKRQQGVDTEIILVDNCSKEEDVIALRDLAQEQGCTLIENKENRGYNAGNNIGLRYASERGYKYALIANPDMEFPQPDYLARMVAKMDEDPQIVVCGSNIIDLDGLRQSPKRFTSYSEELFWFFYSFKRLICKHSGSIILSPKNQYCDMLMGSCILVSIDFIKQIDFFDEGVFLYCEEPILGKQVAKSNKKMFYFHDITALHAHKESAKGSFVKRHDFYWRSRWYYLVNHAGYSKLQLSLMWISKKIFYLIKRIEFIIKNQK